MLAVAEQLLVGLVAMSELVLLEGDQQIEKRLRRNMKTLDRLVEGDHDRVPGLALITAQQFLPPPVQQVESPLATACFVGEIVGPAAIGVHGMKMPQQIAWQEQRRDGEVLIVSARQPAAIGTGSSK